ncbi:uncharacterized protein EI97DRAFT_433199 [Westerdykella ornata]|uniref:CENP-V/GFA domain-containing protein n=1 Tax=Westerdykella ornata TaxID=318751 RepID=A0A6A6JK67_WESOR|nr:uncharacterized protein EI97DRAFT_433199 [Westerdykella ornata]KAF2276358.1 hypothetical protein EI97DRAFT_433199 [Westerdykella ornata]
MSSQSQPIDLTGSCYCRNLTFQMHLDSKDDARTSLCHCKNCKKAFGGAFGLTTKVPLKGFRYAQGSGEPTVHVGDNGSGTNLYREFCPKCGSYICEYGEQAKSDFRYIATGALDDPSAVPPKGEFFCSLREGWMPEVPNVFHKQKIKE